MRIAFIVGYRCAHDIVRRQSKSRGGGAGKKRACPECDRSVSSRLFLNCNGDGDSEMEATMGLTSHYPLPSLPPTTGYYSPEALSSSEAESTQLYVAGMGKSHPHWLFTSFSIPLPRGSGFV